jgi:hypothetical protein
MRIVLALLGLLGSAAATENLMSKLMAKKEAHRMDMRSQGVFAPGKYDATVNNKPCVGGKASNYACNNVDLHSFISHEALGSTTREGNDVWGMSSHLFGSDYQGGRLIRVESLGSLARLMAPLLSKSSKTV